MKRDRLALLPAFLLAASAAPVLAQTPDEFVALVRKGQSRLSAAEAASAGYRCQRESLMPPPPTKSASPATTKSVVKQVASVVVRHKDKVLLELEPVSSGRDANAKPLAKMCLTDEYMFAISGLSNNSIWSLVQFTRPDREGAFRETLGAQTPNSIPAPGDHWPMDN